MRFTMFITEDALQFNLQPETEHEKKFIRILKDYQGPVFIKKGVNIQECHGGYLRDFGHEEDALAIKIDRIRKEPPDA